MAFLTSNVVRIALTPGDGTQTAFAGAFPWGISFGSLYCICMAVSVGLLSGMTELATHACRHSAAPAHLSKHRRHVQTHSTASAKLGCLPLNRRQPFAGYALESPPKA